MLVEVRVEKKGCQVKGVADPVRGRRVGCVLSYRGGERADYRGSDERRARGDAASECEPPAGHRIAPHELTTRELAARVRCPCATAGALSAPLSLRPPLPAFREENGTGLVLRDGRWRGLRSLRPTLLIQQRNQIGRANLSTPVTNQPHACPLLPAT